jgi:hypothetical protein
VVEAQSRCAHDPLRRRDRARQSARQAAAGRQVDVCHGTDARHGRWEKPWMDPPGESLARERPAEREALYARRADAHGEGGGARPDVSGVLQSLEHIGARMGCLTQRTFRRMA